MIVVATVDTATAALTKPRDAQGIYQRAWGVDDSGQDVSGDELFRRSLEERDGS